jgi:hypothetical protein
MMPSLCELNPLTAYQFDAAVTHFGTLIENALHETVKVGSGNNVEYKPKYRLSLLLDPRFRLPRPAPEPTMVEQNPWQPLLDLVGQPRSGVRAYKYVGPLPEKPS